MRVVGDWGEGLQHFNFGTKITSTKSVEMSGHLHTLSEEQQPLSCPLWSSGIVGPRILCNVL